MKTTTNFQTLEEIHQQKALLRDEIHKEEEQIKRQWNSLIQKPEALSAAAKPSRRIQSALSIGANAFDAFLLGYKLWRRFRR